MNNDSFSNLNVVDSPTSKNIKHAKSKMEVEGNLKESAIETKEGDASSFIGDKSTFVFPSEGQVPTGLIYGGKAEHPANKDCTEEYVDDDDPGFDAYMVNE